MCGWGLWGSYFCEGVLCVTAVGMCCLHCFTDKTYCGLLQVYVGRQHHLAVEIGGQQFELTLNNQPTDAANAGDPGSPIQHKALPMPQVRNVCSSGCFVLPEHPLFSMKNMTSATATVSSATAQSHPLTPARALLHLLPRQLKHVTDMQLSAPNVHVL